MDQGIFLNRKQKSLQLHTTTTDISMERKLLLHKGIGDCNTGR